MSSRAYEGYVAEVIKELRFLRGADVKRNCRLPGVRQAGSYEIDIVFDVVFDDAVAFRLIVECKNYRRKVTRPVVQQAAQTRDAVTAHKAAIASPNGFSREAIEVARDLGVALWVIAADKPVTVVMAFEGMKIIRLSEIYYAARVAYLSFFGVQADVFRDHTCGLVSADRLNSDPVSRPSEWGDGVGLIEPLHGAAQDYCRFSRGVNAGSAFFSYESHPLFDPQAAPYQIVETLFEEIEMERLVADDQATRLAAWESAFKARFEDGLLGQEALELVRSGDHRAFFKLLW